MVCHEQNPVFDWTDRSGVEAGGIVNATGGLDPSGWHIRADVLSLGKQYAGMQSDQVRELRQLQEENARLKKYGGRTELR